MDDPKALQRVLTEAFRRAAKSREAKGLPPGDAKIRRTRGGGRWVGPSSYRITLWLRPWEYVALLDEHRRSRHKGSITSYIQAMFRPAAAQRAKRAA